MDCYWKLAVPVGLTPLVPLSVTACRRGRWQPTMNCTFRRFSCAALLMGGGGGLLFHQHCSSCSSTLFLHNT